MFMASLPAGNTTIGKISDRFNIPKSHLMKVISTLVAAGYVRSVRGPQGGVSLAKPASEITLKEVVVLMEKTLMPFDCVGQSCVILDSCQLNTTFFSAQEKYLDHLAGFSIADMINNKVADTMHPTETIIDSPNVK